MSWMTTLTMTSGCTDLHLIFNEKLFYDVIETIFIFEVEVMLAVWEDDKAENMNFKSIILQHMEYQYVPTSDG